MSLLKRAPRRLGTFLGLVVSPVVEIPMRADAGATAKAALVEQPCRLPVAFTADDDGLSAAGDHAVAQAAWLSSQLRCARIMRYAASTGQAAIAAHYAFETAISSLQTIDLLKGALRRHGEQRSGQQLAGKMQPYSRLRPALDEPVEPAPVARAQPAMSQAQHEEAAAALEAAYRRAELDHATNPRYANLGGAGAGAAGPATASKANGVRPTPLPARTLLPTEGN